MKCKTWLQRAAAAAAALCMAVSFTVPARAEQAVAVYGSYSHNGGGWYPAINNLSMEQFRDMPPEKRWEICGTAYEGVSINKGISYGEYGIEEGTHIQLEKPIQGDLYIACWTKANSGVNNSVSAVVGASPVFGNLKVLSMNKVVLTQIDGGCSAIVSGTADLYAKEVWLENKHGGPAVGENLIADSAGDVIVHGEGSLPTVGGNVRVAAGGALRFEGGDREAIGGKLVVTTAQSVFVECGDAVTGSGADITCDGPVVLHSTGGEPLGRVRLRRTDDDFTLLLGSSAEDAAVVRDTSILNGRTDIDASYLEIRQGRPDDVLDPVEPEEPGGAEPAGNGAGIAIAAVAIGGAAIVGGYEVTTRVMLHNMLPEGAVIPANRGQLALLVWNTAGRPEPAGTPSFVDVADPDMARAAQWCTEQGILDARGDRFEPEGWTPKFKVIEVWNKAFPKQ